MAADDAREWAELSALFDELSELDGATRMARLAELRAQGARTLAIGDADADVAFGAGLPDVAAGPLYLPVGQLLACERAVARGFDPDRPANLSAVIRLG